MTRLIGIFLLSMIPFAGISQGSWELVGVPTSHHLRSVFFTDSLYGWAVGDTGTIIHTTDGGVSWVLKDAGTQNNIRHVFFLDRERGWASSWNFEGFYGTLLLKTQDGGSNWTQVPYPDDYIFINCILFLDSLTGWMGGSPHALVKTTDGGQSWAQAAIDTNALAFFPVLNVYFYDELHGYACGGMFDIAGVTWSTSDGGALWHPIKTGEAPADEVHGMHLYGPDEVIGAGGDPEQGYGVAMIRTTNGGENWDYEELSMPGNAFDIDFRDENEAWAPLGPQQQLIYSLDAGDTWTRMPSPGNTAIFDMTFPDSMHGYAVGYNGAFLRYKPLGVGLREPAHGRVSARVFPNPADGVIQLSVEGDMGRSGEFSLYSPEGQKVMALPVNGSGKRIDLTGLPPGIYFFRLLFSEDDEPGIITGKLVLW